ncbi:MAG: RNA pseudouridine synthase [Phycisphaerales bacterium]|nr:RNA pseudouridine synthase [Phycisphaerales bacterium]
MHPLLSVWHLDQWWAVLEKPAGLRTVCGTGEGGEDSIEARLQEVFPSAVGSSGGLITHRLDMETSGLLVIARSRPARRSLMKQFEQRKVGKQYVAVVDGEVEGASGAIDLPLAKDESHHVRQQVDAAGRPSRTLWRVLGRSFGRTLVQLKPITGRRHQLRVHMASGLGCPILGDTLYGEASTAPRLLLHASELAFWAPRSGQWVVCRSAAPFQLGQLSGD